MLKITPVLAAKITDKPWEMPDTVTVDRRLRHF
jgi:hypothetical protein